MAYAPRYSEFLTLNVGNADAVPLDLGGACSVALTWLGNTAATGLSISDQRQFAINADPAFVLNNMQNDGGGGATLEQGGTPFVIQASDERLWVCATNGGTGVLYVWITREVGA